MNIEDKFPDLLGKDENGKEVRLSSYPSNVRFIIYFYPKDSTPGCTLEARSLASAYSQFVELGYQIIGVSAGDEKSHQRFIAKNELPFPLIADTEHTLCETAGVWQLLHTGLLLSAYRRLPPHTLLRKRTGKGAHCTWN